MGGDQGVTSADPTVQRHRLLGDQDQALLQQPQQSRSRPRPAMQQPPQGFLVAAGTGMPPSQGSGCFVSAEAAARTRAAEQMAFEDAWKALNPDFKTPFASVEDAVSRCVRARVRSSSLSRPLAFVRVCYIRTVHSAWIFHFFTEMGVRSLWD